MYVLAINHDVEDYERWKAVFDSFPPGEGGARFHRLNRLVDSPDTITVVAGFERLDDALAFRDAPELKEKMGDAGVIGAPRFELYEEVEAVTY